MGTTSDKLSQLMKSKTAIRNAITNAGVEMPVGELFKNYGYYIEQISTLPETTSLSDMMVLADLSEEMIIGKYSNYEYTEQDEEVLTTILNRILEGES